MKEDKIERLLRAMENPSDFTDKELEQLFEDEELRDCYNMAIKAEQGFKLRREQAEQRPQAGYQRVWLKVAAVLSQFSLILFLSTPGVSNDQPGVRVLLVAPSTLLAALPVRFIYSSRMPPVRVSRGVGVHWSRPYMAIFVSFPLK
mgnify:CR=1 FL=1